MSFESPLYRFVFLLLVIGGSATAFADTFSFDFEKTPVDKAPKEYRYGTTGSGAEGNWRVKKHDGNHVLTQTDDNQTVDRYAIAVANGTSFRDVCVSTRIKAIGGIADMAGGVMWRYRDSKNYLVARLDVSEDNLRLYRFRDGNRVQFGVREKLKIKKDQWYTLRVVHRGTEVQVYLDDNVMLIEQERHFQNAGSVGYWTIADSKIHFDDMKAESLEEQDKNDKTDGGK